MKIATFTASVMSFAARVVAAVHYLKKTQFLSRLTAAVLILTLLAPFILTGARLEVSAAAPRKRLAEPKVKMPDVLLEKPLPYAFTETKFSDKFLAAPVSVEKSWWDGWRSWFDFSAPESEKTNDESKLAETDNLSPNLERAQAVLPPPSTADLSRARLAPKNATGGMNLYSRNFGWSAGLAGLQGRGLNAGFGISYNSLVWARVGSEMIFNPDNSNVTPGFQFGYPSIEPNYTDPMTGKNTFLMVTPSGGRAEFRQIAGTTDTFETADSSYIQLKTINANTLLVTGTDGTQMIYELKGGAYKCSQIKDANGNFVTVSHDANGKLQSVTDTLGRVINITYDNDGQPTAITQTRAAGNFTLAAFGYEAVTINTNFAGLTVVGPANGTNLKLLKQVTYADGSSTRFDYNPYGQVWRVANHAADQSKLNHTAVNFNTDNNPPFADCPRFSDIRNWTQNFNFDANAQAQEVVIPINYQENQGFSLPDGTQGAGTLVEVIAPNGMHSKTFFANSGWAEGLPVVTEDWADGGRPRWSRTVYTQDDPNLGFMLNPRSIESKVGDNISIRRSTVEYFTDPGNAQIAVFGLVKEVRVYDVDQTTVLKRAVTNYNFDGQLLARRIIGLPAESALFDQSNALMSRVTYAYDEGNFNEPGQNIAPIQQDNANYGAGFIAGRGNMTSTTRWDVTDPGNTGKAVTARLKYNTAGSPVASVDPLGREIKTVYTDSFDDNQNRNTFAYPTAIIDAGGNASSIKYNFDLGVNVYAVSPAPAGNQNGKTTQRLYDLSTSVKE